MITACNVAYQTFGTCIIKGQSCNLIQATEELKSYNSKKINAEKRIQDLTLQFQSMSEVIKELRSSN